jgi:secreted PhoX family phosphatase
MTTSNSNTHDFAHLSEDASEIERLISRRYFLKGGAGLFGSAAMLGGMSTLSSSVAQAAHHGHSHAPMFEAIAANSDDDITLPAGFRAQVVARWGDPLFSNIPEFDDATRGSAATQIGAVGDNTDGMDIFEVNGKTLLVTNNEYTNLNVHFGNRASEKPETEDDIRKGMYAHGITVMELVENNGQWSIVKDSPYNLRITPQTPIAIAGPARGSALLQTSTDPLGMLARGTFNNCGNGKTPWGTYLTCEENFNKYFSSSEGEAFQQSAEQKRYGIAKKGKDGGYAWAKIDPRFDISQEPNEANRHGWITEIDPSGKNPPRKLTALGRFKHENAEVVVNKDGHVVVYMGDDERGEFVYRFVSRDRYIPGADTDRLLENGDLYAAKFHDDGRGEWVNLNESGMQPDARLVYARLAASRVGATTMDRPEWIAANPKKAEVYGCMTNNKYRGKKDTQPLNAANPRVDNKYGHIVRWTPKNGDHTGREFTWDLFVMAGNPAVHKDAHAGSANINLGNLFNSPDGLRFDSRGNLWIQTDGKYSNTGDFAGMGNNQMLLANAETGEIRRFLVGPKECEITGLTWSPDRKTMFVGVQHPGEEGGSHWPNGGTSVPRSAVIAVRREDGGLIG